MEEQRQETGTAHPLRLSEETMRTVLIGIAVALVLGLVLVPVLMMLMMLIGMSSMMGMIMGRYSGAGGMIMGPVWLMLLIGLVIVVGSLLLVVLGMRYFGETSKGSGETPLAILQRRYARGEIRQEEYERMRAELMRDAQSEQAEVTSPAKTRELEVER